MKFLIVLFSAFTIHQAHATSFMVDAVDTAPCSKVTNMGVLAKDNMPYWANPADDQQDVEACYQQVVAVIEQNYNTNILRSVDESADMSIEITVSKSVKILNTDEEFVSFIDANQATGSDFNVQAPQVNTLIPVPRTPAPAFFTN